MLLPRYTWFYDIDKRFMITAADSSILLLFKYKKRSFRCLIRLGAVDLEMKMPKFKSQLETQHPQRTLSLIFDFSK